MNRRSMGCAPECRTVREVIPSRLYIAAAVDVREEVVKRLKITDIVNCTYTVPLLKNIGERSCRRFAIRDFETEDISPYFEQFYEHVTNLFAHSDCRVLVHCKSGVSRSATLVIAFLMKHHCIPLSEAFEYLRNKGFIFPNMGFWRQLREYDLKCFGKHSVEMVENNGLKVPDVFFKDHINPYYRAYALTRFRGQKKIKQHKLNLGITKPEDCGEDEDEA